MTDNPLLAISVNPRDLVGITGLAETSPDAMICADSQGLITYWNEAAATMFGISRENAIGLSLDLIVPEPMRGAHAAGMKRLARGGAARVVGRVVEVVAQHVSGRTFPIEMSLAMWQEKGNPVFGSVIRDVSERRRNQDRLHQLAHFDQLTLLPNRTMFLERLEASLVDSNSPAVLLIDLDRFKEVNDFFGHLCGDEVLRETAIRLKQCVSAADATVARLGGDEFAVLLPNVSNPLVAANIADQIKTAIREPFDVEARNVLIGCCIGIALAPVHGNSADELIGNADLALYNAKAGGGDSRELYVAHFRENATARRNLETELTRAASQNEFEVYYQPQVNLQNGIITGAEALLRWRHPERGLLAPGAFIKCMETAKQAEAVGQWVLETACRQASDWHKLNPSLRIGVNLFAVQLRSPNLVTNVQKALKGSLLPAQFLELEITEDILLKDDDDSWVSNINALRAKGVGFAFDDYGTGYASLSLLKRFPITRLKIDRSFVRDLTSDSDDAAIVDAVITLARKFKLSVIAEGVETIEQEKHLIRSGCEVAQGYLYGKPMSAIDFNRLLESASYGEENPRMTGRTI
ncbi:MAG TPA: EAL domain-containing protein [Aestuariivirga sp.]|nr:EAL domain-containing protein [Aestuariivirga sp.]